MDQEDEELQRAFQMSLQQPPIPDAKRSRSSATPAESFERRMQRELRAAAAEKRRVSVGIPDGNVAVSRELEGSAVATSTSKGTMHTEELPLHLAEQLYGMVFGSQVSRDVIAQWCNQGFRFSTEPETAFGLVQHEGGPCGVLAPIQATFLKCLLFPGDSSAVKGANVKLEYTDAKICSALIQALSETLWRAGGGVKAVLAVLDLPHFGNTSEEEQDKAVDQILQGVALDSVEGLRRVVRICTVGSFTDLGQQLRNRLAGFRSRMGALLFLFSGLLSRGLDAIQSDRDDPSQPLVTPPFGHASQEIVNLLLCGHAVANVFDGNYDMGGGMSLKGIPKNVDVGFLTLLEFLNFCKVGQYLKRPKWPIWVVGSESHYTVLFALDPRIQDENDLEVREALIRRAFDSKDQSGGGGFISPDALQQVLMEAKIDMPQDMLSNFSNGDIVVWNDLWQALFQVDKSRGGFKDEAGTMGKKHFELYHFNGIAKTVGNSNNGNGSSSAAAEHRPRLTKLRVAVPPKWTPESMMAEAMQTDDKECTVVQEPAQHAPLVDCIRTRWQRATCNWTGDGPSIV